MASPQVENGYTKIANEIMDALCKIRIPGEERQVLDCILRKSYGWNKCEDAISLSQFVEMTGIKKPNVIGAIKGLLSKKIISVIQKDNEPAKVYKFIKDYHLWTPLSKKITLSKKIISVIQKDNSSLSKKIPTKDTTTKDTTKEKATVFIPASINPETWKSYLDMRKQIKKPAGIKAQELIIKRLLKMGGNLNAILEQSIMNSWQGVFEIKDGGNGNGKQRDPGGLGLPREYLGESEQISDQQRAANVERIKQITGTISTGVMPGKV